MADQIKTRTVTCNSIMSTPAFQQGVRDYALARGFKALQMDPKTEWDYERGRLFAAATGAKAIIITRGKVSEKQQLAYSMLSKERIII